jgi:hypothetical protein
MERVLLEAQPSGGTGFSLCSSGWHRLQPVFVLLRRDSMERVAPRHHPRARTAISDLVHPHHRSRITVASGNNRAMSPWLNSRMSFR